MGDVLQTRVVQSCDALANKQPSLEKVHRFTGPECQKITHGLLV